MADTSLNRFIASVADAAERAAFVPSPPTPASGPDSGYFLFQRDDSSSWSWNVDTSDWEAVGSGGPVSADVVVATCNGRVTTESGVAVSTADRTAQSTIYFTPYLGNQVALYDGADWHLETFAQLSLALSGLTSGKNYDVFLDYNAGTPQIVLSTAWTNNTTRADALTLQDGVPVKSGATDHRLIGTMRTTGTTTTEDSEAKRFVWNATNRVARPMAGALETTVNWVYTTATYRQSNANTANQLMYVVGLNDRAVDADVQAIVTNAGSGLWVAAGVGVDSTTVNASKVKGLQVAGGKYDTALAHYFGYPGIGYHELVWLEYSEAGSTTTWGGDGGVPTLIQAGITGSVWN